MRLLALALAAAVAASPAPCPDNGKGYVAGTVLVGLDPKWPAAKRAELRKAFGVIAERPLLLPGAWVFRVPCDADVPALCKRIAAHPGVKYAEADQIGTLDGPAGEAGRK